MKAKPMLAVFRMGPFGALITITSIVLTSLILFYLWSWLNPVDFWQKLVAVIVSLIAGFILFILILVFQVLLIMPFMMRKAMKKMMKQAAQKEPEWDEEEGYL